MEQCRRQQRRDISRSERDWSRRTRSEDLQRPPHQIIDAQAVLEAGMGGAWPDAVTKAELLYPLEPNELGCSYQIELEWCQGDEIVQAVANGALGRAVEDAFTPPARASSHAGSCVAGSRCSRAFL